MREGQPALEQKKGLNPLSANFQPFSSPVQTVPDISQLSFSDKASDSSADGAAKPRSREITPPRFASGTSTVARTPTLTSSTRTAESDSSRGPISPFTPRTPFYKSFFTPLTPFTPTSSRGQNDRNAEEEKKPAGAVSGFDGVLENEKEIGRYLLISGLPKYIEGSYVQQIIGAIAPYKVILVKNLKYTGTLKKQVIVAFYDPREALKVHRHLRANTVALQEGAPRLSLHCSRIEKYVVDQIADRGEGWGLYWDNQEDTVVLDVAKDKEVLLLTVETVLDTIGDVQSVTRIGKLNKFIIHFWDTRHAADAIKQLNSNDSCENPTTCRYLMDDFENTHPRELMRRATSGPANFTLGSAVQAGQNAGLGFRLPEIRGSLSSNLADLPHTPRTPMTATTSSTYQASPTDDWRALRLRFSSSSNQEYSLPRPYGSFDPPPVSAPSSVDRRSSATSSAIEGLLFDIGNASRVRRESWPVRFGVPNNKLVPTMNVIHPERVLNGDDPRTTVMIKDVPNKLERKELLDILNETVPGGFDFVYLRFDFRNACNVGYAFVNFTSLQHLFDFMTQRAGKKWNLFSSDKVLQIAYADIQGKQRLINKFRNSDVMAAPEKWRPLIFYSEGAHRGEVEPFPLPDYSYPRSGLEYSRPLTAARGGLTFEDTSVYDYTTANFDQSFGI